MKYKHILLLCLCCLLAFSACSGAEEGAPGASPDGNIHVEMPAPAPVRIFTAYELSRLFENSRTEVNDLMGSVIQVTGIARFVEGGLSLDRETQYGYIVCKMSDYSAEYDKVNRGDTVVVVGTLTAEFAYIYLEECYYLGTTDYVATTAAPVPTPSGESSSEGTELFGGWERLALEELGDGKCILRYRIRPGWNNEATIHQNYYIVQDFIQSEGGSAYTEITYYGLMDMGDGNDETAISFKLDAGLIKEIADGTRPAPIFGAYATELWVHENLRLDPVPQSPQETPPVLRTTPVPVPTPYSAASGSVPTGAQETPTPSA